MLRIGRRRYDRFFLFSGDIVEHYRKLKQQPTLSTLVSNRNFFIPFLYIDTLTV